MRNFIHSFCSYRTTVPIAVTLLANLLVPPATIAESVNFSDSVLPILQKNCLACHNESEQEGELIMESVEQLLDGGDSGPAVIAGDAAESLMYQLATHEEEPVMPPLDNDVGAKQLTPEELQILKSWIDQGAKDESEDDSTAKQIDWRPIPDELANVLTLELSPDGRRLVSGRGNKLILYSVPLEQMEQTLVDSTLPSSHADCAHLDSVQSIAWSPDQTLIASGGFRVVKIWQRKPDGPKTASEKQTKFRNDDGTRTIQITGDGETAKLTADDKELAALSPDVVNKEGRAAAEFAHGLRTQKLGVLKADVESAKKQKTEAENDVKKADEEIKKANDDVAKKEEALAKSRKALQDQEDLIQADKKQQKELTANAEQINNKLGNAEPEAKAKIEKEKQSNVDVQKKLTDAIANKTKERDKRNKDLEKKEQELIDAKKAVERATTAKQRLEEIVVKRQTQIEQSSKTLADHQIVVDASAKSLEEQKKAGVSPWVHGEVSPNEKSFLLQNEAGAIAHFNLSDGSLVSVDPSTDLGEWQLVQTIGDPNGESPFADRVTSLAFRHDGKVLAVGGGQPSRTGEVQLWNTKNWTAIGSIEDIHSDVVYDLQFAPLGNHLVSCASDRMVKLIDSETAKHVRTFEGHTGHVLGVSWRANGRMLATAGADQVVKVWDAKEGGQKKTISGFKGEVTAVRYLGLDDRMVFSTGKGDLHSRNSDGKNKPGFGRLTDYIHRISCSRDGKVVAAAGTNRTIRVWSSDGKQIAEFK